MTTSRTLSQAEIAALSRRPGIGSDAPIKSRKQPVFKSRQEATIQRQDASGKASGRAQQAQIAADSDLPKHLMGGKYGKLAKPKLASTYKSPGQREMGAGYSRKGKKPKNLISAALRNLDR